MLPTIQHGILNVVTTECETKAFWKRALEELWNKTEISMKRNISFQFCGSQWRAHNQLYTIATHASLHSEREGVMANFVIFIMHRTVLFNCMHILQKRAPSSVFTHTPMQNKCTPITTMWSPPLRSNNWKVKKDIRMEQCTRFPYVKAKSNTKF